ncbi:MAG: hypothetical protein ACE5R6_19980 [Candidatus Heimdallarchaeota archaeon]
MQIGKFIPKSGEEGASLYLLSVARPMFFFAGERDWLTANEVEHTFVRGGSRSFDWKSPNTKRFPVEEFPVEGGANGEKWERE